MMNKIEYPIVVKGIEYSGQKRAIEHDSYRGHEGKFVSVRPVDSIDPEEKTYLGLYIGEAAIGKGVKYDESSGKLTVFTGYGNPAIWVFDLNRVVLGCESWWGVIRSEEDLEDITDADIQDIWYVKAMKALIEKEGAD